MQTNRRIEYKDDDLVALRQQNPEVNLVSGVLYQSDTLSYKEEYNSYSLQGVHPDKAIIDKIKMTVGNGRFINEVDILQKRKVIVISPRIKKCFFRSEDPLGKYVNAGDVPYQVVGVYTDEDNNNNVWLIFPFYGTATLPPGVWVDNIIFSLDGINTKRGIRSIWRNVSVSRWGNGICLIRRSAGNRYVEHD